MRRGDLRWGTPPLPGGRPKKRPFLVVSHDAFNTNERYTKVMVVHLTSFQRLGGPYDWEVQVPRGIARLPKTSVIKCAEIYTLLKVHMGDLIGTLPGAYMQRVDRALAVALPLQADTGTSGAV